MLKNIVIASAFSFALASAASAHITLEQQKRRLAAITKPC